MRIGVVSDTHIVSGGRRALPPILFEAFEGVDAILHAGDVVCATVLDDLAVLAPVYGVRGNCDPPELWSLLPLQRILEFDGVRIGMIHGHGTNGTTPQRALRTFARANVDCVVFGHSHQPLCLEQDGILLFNPGSPTDRRLEPRFSYGMLTITDGHIAGEIVRF